MDVNGVTTPNTLRTLSKKKKAQRGIKKQRRQLSLNLIFTECFSLQWVMTLRNFENFLKWTTHIF